MELKLVSKYKPTGDQPNAIKELTQGVKDNIEYQTLLGVTGSGKTYTIANVLKNLNRPTLILSHNKTLAAQLYSEFKSFFPDNAVEYFVSYYDYYQPEAYIPSTNTYIEKDLSINDEIEKLRLSTASSLLSGRRDVIVVSSVSCLYGIGNPDDFHASVINLKVGQVISINVLLRNFVDALYSRTMAEFNRGNFRVKGDTIDIYPAYADYAYKITFWDDEIEEIETFDPINGIALENKDEVVIYPANNFITSKDRTQLAIRQIQDDMVQQTEYMKSIGKHLEAKRLEEKVIFDLEMIKELGHCSGIENYSRYFDGRKPGTRPFCLIDYFPDDFITVIDESHVTIPQIRAMFGGDSSRKKTLVEYGFRLPSAMDNRPLKFEEYEDITKQTIYVSATPADYELEQCEGVYTEQVIRPTGLLDPIIEVRPSQNQIDDLMHEIQLRIEKNERTLVTTLTKRMAEELSNFLLKNGVRCMYIHSDIDTIERVEIIEKLRSGIFDVIIGVNLLREGLDMPEVSLVAIIDADKEGFLRSTRSLTQTAGRAARNVNGMVIMYADKITKSMQETINQTNYRREKQIKYNEDNNITPTPIVKSIDASITGKYQNKEEEEFTVADPVIEYMSKENLLKSIEATKQKMQKASKNMEFLEAAQFRDEMFRLEKILKEKFN